MRFKETEKEFIILSNRRFLINRARELYDEDVYLISDTEYTEDGELSADILLWMKENDKAAVLIYYSQLMRFSFQIVCFKANGKWSQDYLSERVDATPDAIKQVINAIPTREKLLQFMRRETILKEIDYTDRCGNCHQFISPCDKYCKYCGTEKGKGRFLPFENKVYFMYGPPTLIKTKCSNCGNISLHYFLPDHEASYCTNCGLKTTSIIKTRTTWDQFGIVGTKEPFDENNRPVMFTAEQVDRLLLERGQICEIDGGYNSINTDKVIEVMRKIEIELPERLEEDYPQTEFEGEQIFLAHIILGLYGKNRNGSCSKYVKCPSCGNNRIAVIAYTISEDDKGDCCAIHYPSGEHLMRSYSEFYYNLYYSKENGHTIPAFICLCCGKEFGNLKYPDDDKKGYQMIKYRKRDVCYSLYEE